MTNGQALSVLKTKYFNTVQTEKRDIEFWAGLRARKEKTMKKLWKMALLTILGTCIALCLGISAAADEGTIQNGLKQQFTWETDLAAGTLTITGEGQLPQNVHMEGEVYPWADDEEQIKTLILKGKDIYPTKYDYNVYYCHFLEKIVGELGDGFTWTLDVNTGTVTLTGKGTWPEDTSYCFLSKIVISEGITDFGATTSVYQSGGHCLADAYLELPVYEVSDTVNLINPQRGEYYVDSGNPYYASFDGCLYSKDYTKLITVPSGKTAIEFHPNTKILGTACFSESISSPLIIPWGVTTLEPFALTWTGIVGKEFITVFPDTLVNIAKEGHAVSRQYRRVYYCSAANQAVQSALHTTEQEDHGGYVHVEVLPSLAEYYPDIPEAQGSTPVSEPSQPPISQPESGRTSAPVVSQSESSQPSESSSTSSQEPSAPSSQPSVSSGTSSQPTSEPSSSQPEESSMSEESNAVSEEPSSEASISEPENNESEENKTSKPAAAPGEQSDGAFRLWPIFLLLGAAVICVAAIIFFIWRKK